MFHRFSSQPPTPETEVSPRFSPCLDDGLGSYAHLPWAPTAPSPGCLPYLFPLPLHSLGCVRAGPFWGHRGDTRPHAQQPAQLCAPATQEGCPAPRRSGCLYPPHPLSTAPTSCRAAVSAFPRAPAVGVLGGARGACQKVTNSAWIPLPELEAKLPEPCNS